METDTTSGADTSLPPLKGLYVFSCTVMAVNGNDVSVEMVKNGQKMMNAYSSRSAWDTATISAALALVKGDKVFTVGDIFMGIITCFLDTLFLEIYNTNCKES